MLPKSFGDKSHFFCRVLAGEEKDRYVGRMEEIETLTQPSPWDVRSLAESFEEPYVIVGLFAEDLLCGFSVIYGTAFSTDLLTIGVDPHYQGRGLGKFLLECTLEQAREHCAEECFLEVRCSNYKAISLYEKAGFLQIGVRKAYYTPGPGETAEDALTMRLSL